MTSSTMPSSATLRPSVKRSRAYRRRYVGGPPRVDWQRVAGLRDILAHSYFAIDNPTIWDIIQNKLPRLLVEVKRLREEPE